MQDFWDTVLVCVAVVGTIAIVASLILLWSQSNEVAEWWIDKVRLMGSFASGRNWFIKCCIYFWICCVVLIAVVQFLAMVVAAAFFLGVYTLFLAAWLGGCLALIGFFA